MKIATDDDKGMRLLGLGSSEQLTTRDHINSPGIMPTGGIMGIPIPPMPGYIMPMPGYMKENMPADAAAAMPRSIGFIMGREPNGFNIDTPGNDAGLNGPTPGITGSSGWKT